MLPSGGGLYPKTALAGKKSTIYDISYLRMIENAIEIRLIASVIIFLLHAESQYFRQTSLPAKVISILKKKNTSVQARFLAWINLPPHIHTRPSAFLPIFLLAGLSTCTPTEIQRCICDGGVPARVSL